MLSHRHPNSRNRVTDCALQLVWDLWNQAFTGFPAWPLTSFFSYPFLSTVNALVQKKKLMLLLRVSYLDWSHLLPSASHLKRSLWPRTAQVSQGPCSCRVSQYRSLQSRAPTCGRWASGYLYSGWFYSGYYELFLQPWLLDVECILVLKNWVLFGSMFFLRMIAGPSLITEFCYSVFFSQLGI